MAVTASFSGLGFNISSELSSALRDARDETSYMSSAVLMGFEEELDCINTTAIGNLMADLTSDADIDVLASQDILDLDATATSQRPSAPTQPTQPPSPTPAAALIAVFLSQAALLERCPETPLQAVAGHSVGLAAAILASATAGQGPLTTALVAGCVWRPCRMPWLSF